MNNQNKQTQSDFLEETIKKRPVNRQKVAKRMIEVSLLAILFGAIACATIVLLSPVLENMIFSEEEEEAESVVAEMDFAEDSLEVVTEEIAPEDMLAEDTEDVPEETVVIVEETITAQQIVEEEAQLFADLAESCSGWLVTVRGVYNNESWLESSLVSASESSGAIVTESDTELYILTNSGDMGQADYIELTFADGTSAVGTIRGEDGNTGLMILSVSKGDLSAETLEQISTAVFSSSNLKSNLGSRVLAVGNPMGVSGSYVSGTITAMGIEVNSWDINYKVLMTDIYASQSPQGFLVNLRGYIVGVLCNDYNSSDTGNILSALGITELKKTIELMYNGSSIPRLGIQGIDVTAAANEGEGVPLGAYVTEVLVDSAAMSAGIQVGDIVTAMDETEIKGMSELTSCLLSHQAGDAVSVTICRLSQGEYREIELHIILQED
ncbi:MAG: S1C family serine protease [Lachnospiraceae bacterium]|nr:S1C family serine protease [Lachnospiraceae bacterium]